MLINKRKKEKEQEERNYPILCPFSNKATKNCNSLLSAFLMIQSQYKTIEIYWGNRTFDEFYWKPQFEAIEINFNLILSRKISDWQGMFGYVQDAVLLSNSNLHDSVVYASGSPAMIESAKSLFARKGLKEDCFFSDAFYSS